MWKKLLLVLVLVGFAWSYPPTRRSMTNALAPALSKLGPVGDRIVEPTRHYDARNEVDFIASQIEMHRTEGRALPNPRTFEKWVKERVSTRRQGIDPWGRSYYLVRANSRTIIGSDGADRQRGTDDDVRKTLPF